MTELDACRGSPTLLSAAFIQEHLLALLAKLMTATALLKLTCSYITVSCCALSAGVIKSALGQVIGITV